MGDDDDDDDDVDDDDDDDHCLSFMIFGNLWQFLAIYGDLRQYS